MTDAIGERYARFAQAVDDEVRACARTDAPRIIAVSKKQSAPAIAAAVRAGVTDIGENYVQESKAKFAELARDFPEARPRKHYIGHVQTNKARAIAELFDLVQSVDRLDAGVALARAATALGKRLPVLVQLNISPAERFGAAPEGAERLAEQLRALDGLQVEGVMAVGPMTADRAEIARSFELAAKTLGRVGGSTLSIGMSGDWREAVRAGSTMLRIGTAIFGPRGGAEDPEPR